METVVHAYDELYLNNAMEVLGGMVQYAVCNCRMGGDEVLGLFIAAGAAEAFGRGDPRYVAERSGQELFREVLEKTHRPYPPATLRMFFAGTPEYWCGRLLAYYQWFYNVSFADIHAKIPFQTLLDLHPTLRGKTVQKAAEALHNLSSR